MVKSLLLSTVIAVALTGAAFAQSGACTAEVGQISGKLLVNQGNGFRPLRVGAVLHPGDVVMASGDSSGVLKFSDGTTGKVVEANAVRIPGSAPCAGVQSSPPETTEAAGGMNPGYVGAGVAVLAVGALVGVAVLGNHHSSPVSP